LTLVPATNGLSARVQWGGGPAFGEAEYEASANYVWQAQVNIVQVNVVTPTFVPGNIYGNGEGQLNQVNTLRFKSIVSLHSGIVNGKNVPVPGISYSALVTLIGPDGNKGVSKIKVGFVQDLNLARYQVTYGTRSGIAAYAADPGNPAGAAIAVGSTYWDTIDNLDPNNPWYDMRESALFQGSKSSSVKTITSEDSPEVFPPVAWGPPGLGQANISALNVHFDFALYVAAQSVDPDTTNAPVVAQALSSWSFDASGAIGGGNGLPWTPGASAGIRVPLGFTPLRNGFNPLAGDAQVQGAYLRYNDLQNNHMVFVPST
jgi:hypothetical protein